jgi:glycosyltransferase involved in cell wall biosynthesis
VRLAGPPLDDALANGARAEMRANPRFLWLGALSHAATSAMIAGSDLLVVSSLAEGGANVVGEAIVAGTPVVGSRIEGTTGLVGDDYPGLFPVGDTGALRALLLRAESDLTFLDALRERCEALAPLFAPERERAAWASLLASLAADGSARR